MTEYIEREALIDAFEYADPDVCEVYPDEYSEWGYGIRSVRDVIRSVPAADVAPVVRCKECEHAERYERTDGTVGYYCGHPQNTFTYGEHWDRAFKPAKEADDFCSYGEPKMNGGVSECD